MDKFTISRISTLLCLLIAAILLSSCRKQDACSVFRNTKVGSNWAKIVEAAPKCLSIEETKTLNGTAAGALMSLHSEEDWTVQQVLDAAKQVEKDAQSSEIGDIVNDHSDGAEQPQQDIDGFLAQIVPRAVAFIYKAGDDGKVSNPSKGGIGTGFVTCVPLTSDPSRSIRFLFTARHIVDPKWAAPNVNISNPTQLYIRTNKRDPAEPGHTKGVIYSRVGLGVAGKLLYLVPADNTVDAAAILLGPNTIPFDSAALVPIPLSMFATDEELKTIKPNLAVYSAGLVPGTAAEGINQPIPINARLKVISDQLQNAYYDLNFTAKPIRVWLISPRLAAGFSGAPILAVASRQIQGQTKRGPVLIGIQSMSLDKDADLSGIAPLTNFTSILDQISQRIPEANVKRGFAPSDNGSCSNKAIK